MGATFIKLFEVIESVRAVDAKTVEIKLKSPTVLRALPTS